MVTVHDVAAYILQAKRRMTAMKLQKLVYYAQAWSLVWDDSALFEEPIQAWAMGPVVPDLYEAHRGEYVLTSLKKGDAGALSEEEIGTVDAILKFYGDKSAHWLSNLTHQERPWLDARESAGAQPGSFCDAEISHASMAEYYAGLPQVS